MDDPQQAHTPRLVTAPRHVASYLGKESLQVAEHNLLRDGDETHYHVRMEDCNVRRCWEEVLQQADYQRRLEEVQHFNRWAAAATAATVSHAAHAKSTRTRYPPGRSA